MHKSLNSLSQVAEYFDVSNYRVRQWKQRGCPALLERPYDTAAIKRWVDDANEAHSESATPVGPAIGNRDSEESPERESRQPSRDSFLGRFRARQEYGLPLIENVVVGLISFVTRYVVTASLIPFRTRTIAFLITRGIRQRPISEPITFLVMSAILLMLVLQFSQSAIRLTPLDEKRLPATFSEVSFRSFVVTSVPCVLLAMALAHVCGRFVGGANKVIRQHFRMFVVYVIGFQLLVYAIYVTLFAIHRYERLTGALGAFSDASHEFVHAVLFAIWGAIAVAPIPIAIAAFRELVGCSFRRARLRQKLGAVVFSVLPLLSIVLFLQILHQFMKPVTARALVPALIVKANAIGEPNRYWLRVSVLLTNETRHQIVLNLSEGAAQLEVGGAKYEEISCSFSIDRDNWTDDGVGEERAKALTLNAGQSRVVDVQLLLPEKAPLILDSHGSVRLSIDTGLVGTSFKRTKVIYYPLGPMEVIYGRASTPGIELPMLPGPARTMPGG